MKIFTKTILVILTGFILSSVAQAAPTFPTTPTAPDIAPQPCDTQYWKQMSARAWMEAEREIMQNQNLIFKPDSVLEYVCFDQFASVAAHEGGKIFTHTNYFGQEIIPYTANGALPTAISNVVSKALTKYLNGSFDPDYLGGRADKMGIGNKDRDANSGTNSMKPATDNVGYTCNEMANVWKAAKCSNFIDDSAFQDTDGFYPFKAIKGHNTPDVAGYDTIQETRLFPSSMSCRSSSVGARGNAAQTLGPAGTWKNQIDLASNIDGNLYQYQAPLAAIYEEVGEKLEPGNCGQPGIATGVTVYLQGHRGVDGGASHLDGVCTNPGCVYEKGSLSEPGSCVAVE